MAMTIEQQRAVAMAQAKAKAAGQQSAAPAAQTSAPDEGRSPLQAVADNLSAGFVSGVDAIPFVGPSIMNGLNGIKAAVHGTTPEAIAADSKRLQDQNQIASVTGTVAGNVLPFVAGGEIPVLAKGLGMVGNIGSRMLAGGLSSAAITGADSYLTRGDSLGEAGKKAGIAGLLGVAAPVAEAGLGGIWRGLTRSQAPKAAQNVSRALRDDGVQPGDVTQKLMDLGPDGMLMDLGPNSQSLAGGVASVPGPGQATVRQAVADRRAGASGRVADDVARTIGTGPDLDTLKASIIKQQSQVADPLYAKVRNMVLPDLPAVTAVIGTPLGQRAYQKAIELWKNDFKTNAPPELTVGIVDYMKRALDDIAGEAVRAGRGNDARQAGNMTKALTSSVDRVVPEYKLARDAFAGPAQVLDAIDSGSTVFSREMSPGQLKTALSGMSQSERDGFLQGAQAQVEAMMGNAVNDVAALRNTFKKGYNEAKLRYMLGDDIADDLLKSIDRELTFGNTSNIVSSNSETARRQAVQGIVNPDLGQAPRISTTITGLIVSAFDKARGAIQGIRQPAINAKMAKLLSSNVNDMTPEMIRQLQIAARYTGKGLVAPAAAGGIGTDMMPADGHPWITVNGGANP
jgi:hypothetical protein